MNERLHRRLNRSLLCGVSKIGPERGIAIMCCALFAWNCRRKDKKFGTMRAKPVHVVPIETVKETGLYPPKLHMKLTTNSSTKKTVTASNRTSPTGLPVGTGCETTVEELKTGNTLQYIVQKVLHLQEFISSFSEIRKNKTVDVLALLWSKHNKIENLIESEAKMNTLGLDLTDQHGDNMIRNLSGLNLELDEVGRDGDLSLIHI